MDVYPRSRPVYTLDEGCVSLICSEALRRLRESSANQQITNLSAIVVEGGDSNCRSSKIEISKTQI